MFGSGYYQYRDVDKTFLQQMMIMRRECRQVHSAVQALMTTTVGNGVAFFRGDVEERDVPDVMNAWVERTIRPFLSVVLDHLACFGYVVYTVNPETMDVTVMEADRVRLQLRRTLYGPIEYCATLVEDTRMRLDHDPRLHVYVLEQFDWVTGRNGGCLSKCYTEYLCSKVMLRNERTMSTNNAHSLYILEHTDRRQVQNLFTAVTPVVQDFDESIPGLHVSGQDRMDTRKRVIETIHTDDKKLSRDMSTAEFILPAVGTDMTLVDTNPCEATFIPAPAGRAAHQRTYAPETKNLTGILVLLNRMIADAFQVELLIIN